LRLKPKIIFSIKLFFVFPSKKKMNIFKPTNERPGFQT
jgi:hypothetical protein